MHRTLEGQSENKSDLSAMNRNGAGLVCAALWLSTSLPCIEYLLREYNKHMEKGKCDAQASVALCGSQCGWEGGFSCSASQLIWHALAQCPFYTCEDVSYWRSLALSWIQYPCFASPLHCQHWDGRLFMIRLADMPAFIIIVYLSVIPCDMRVMPSWRVSAVRSEDRCAQPRIWAKRTRERTGGTCNRRLWELSLNALICIKSSVLTMFWKIGIAFWFCN